MTPAKLNLTIYQGATFEKVFQYLTGTPAVPVDMTDWAGRMQCRPLKKSPTIIFELTTEDDGIVILDQEEPDIGKFKLFMSAEDTAALDFLRGEYDVELEDLEGRVIRILQGSVSLNKEVTRPVPTPTP